MGRAVSTILNKIGNFRFDPKPRRLPQPKPGENEDRDRAEAVSIARQFAGPSRRPSSRPLRLTKPWLRLTPALRLSAPRTGERLKLRDYQRVYMAKRRAAERATRSPQPATLAEQSRGAWRSR